MKNFYLGIDPGKNGGLAIVQQDKKLVRIKPMPETEKGIFDWIEQFPKPEFAVIEKVHSSPGMGVVSAFTFGKGYGSLLMLLTALKIPFEEVRPQVWQKLLLISPRKKKPKKKRGERLFDYEKRIKGKKHETSTQWKTRLKQEAEHLFPSLGIWEKPKSKGKQLAIADALLIAEYCRRTHGN